MTSLVLTRVAHASVLLDFGGSVILTDPWFSEKSGYYHGEPYGVALAELPRLAGVVGSHAHYDHFDMRSFAQYPDKRVPFAVKSGMAAAARQVGFSNLTELEPWESTQLGDLRVTATLPTECPKTATSSRKTTGPSSSAATRCSTSRWS